MIVGRWIELLKHPSDPEWLMLGIIAIAWIAWAALKTLYIEHWRNFFLKKYVGFDTEINVAISIIKNERFSFMGKLIYILAIILSISIISLSYYSNTRYDEIAFNIFIGFGLAYLFFSGYHFMINKKIISAMRFLNEIRNNRIDNIDKALHTATQGDAFIAINGAAMMLIAIFIASCWLCQFPVSLYALAKMAQ